MKTIIELEKHCDGCAGCGNCLKIGFVVKCPCSECLVKMMCMVGCNAYRGHVDEYSKCIRQQISKTKDKENGT